MRKIEINSGDKYNYLTVVEEVEGYRKPCGAKVRRFLCRCICGEECYVNRDKLVYNKKQSCGCKKNETISKKVSTHGLSKSRIYFIWLNMKGRCNSDNRGKDTVNYKDRGIGYDPKWEVFENFLEDMLEGYNDDLTMDRIDNDQGYSKENCRWVDYSMQGFNQRKRTTNTSGRTGVYRTSDDRYWVARLFYRGEDINLGCFHKFEDAVKAREEAELKYFGFIKE